MGPWCGPEVIGCDSSIEVAMKMLNVVGLGPPGFAAREERSCFSWHTAAGGPGGTWKFVERPSSEAGLEAFVSSAMDAAVKEVSAPREVALKRCANCRAIFYCSPACQKKNWKMHKKVCKQLKAEREAARVADGIGQLRV